MPWHGSKEKYIDNEEVRKLRQIDEGHYFNMGPIYIFGVAMFTVFRIFSIGPDSREFYLYFSTGRPTSAAAGRGSCSAD